MANRNRSDVLPLLASALAKQVDHAAASALLAAAVHAEPPVETQLLAQVLPLRCRAHSLDARGAHGDARQIYARVLQVLETYLDTTHVDVLDALNDAARCRLNAGDYTAALPLYVRLLGATQEIPGQEQTLAEITRANIASCHKGLRDQQATKHLDRVLAPMFQRPADRSASRGSAEAPQDPGRPADSPVTGKRPPDNINSGL